MKEKELIIDKFYLNKSDVAKLLGVTELKARRIYEQAEKLDIEQLPIRLEERKVRTKSVLRVMGLTYEEVKKRMTS